MKNNEERVVIRPSVSFRDFPVGFSWMMDDGATYKVKEEINKDPNQSMRRVLNTTTGGEEIMSIETIKQDLLQEGTQIIDAGSTE